MAIKQDRILALLDETEKLETQQRQIQQTLDEVLSAYRQGRIGVAELEAQIFMLLQTSFKYELNNHYAERAHFKRFARRNERERARQSLQRLGGKLAPAAKPWQGAAKKPELPEAVPEPHDFSDGVFGDELDPATKAELDAMIEAEKKDEEA